MKIKKIKKKIKNPTFLLPAPKISYGRLGQLIFTLREITKIALKIQPKLILALFVVSALWGFLAIPGFYFEKLIIDRLIQVVGAGNWKPAVVSIGWLVLVALIFSLIRNLLGSLQRLLRRNLGRYFDAELSAMLSEKITSLDMPIIDDPKFQDRFNKVQAESSRRVWELMMPISDIPNFLVGFFSSVGVLIFLNPLIAVGVFIASLPQFFIDSKFIKKEYELHTKLTSVRRARNWTDHYLLRNSNYMEMKVLGISGYLIKKFRDAWEMILTERVSLAKKRELSRVLGSLPLTLFELIVSLFLIFWVIVERITVGSFSLYLRTLRNASMNLSGLVNSFVSIYENYVYVTDLIWFLNLEPNIEKDVEGKKDIPAKLDLSLKDVKFRYDGSKEWIIKGINLKIEQGEKIALVGENGVGKTTLIRLIARFYDPTKGKIMINGEDIKEFNLTDWRKNIAILFQDYTNYIYSVQESIGYGDVFRIDDLESIKKAAAKAGIDEYIESLPLKYNSPLNPRFEKGVRPSTGQLQRIGIARTLFRENANVVILDEPTSNVDPKAEELIFNELLKKTEEKIFIFVSQRFSTVRRADRILVMDKGKIVEDGTHQELMEKKGLYEELFTLQAKAYQ